MRLKHFLYSATIVCALAEIGMALYAMYWTGIISEIAAAEKTPVETELIVLRSLNIALPMGICFLALLLYIWKMDSIGGFSFFLALAMHLIGLDLNVRAVRKIYGEDTPLASVTWWAPDNDSRGTAPSVTGDRAS